MIKVATRAALLLTIVVLQACGGRHRSGYPWHVAGPTETQVAALAQQHIQVAESWQQYQVSARYPSKLGVATPVALRTYEDGVVIIDVLLYRPKTGPYWAPDLHEDHRRLKYFVYNGMTAFDAADGEGFRIRHCDGADVRLMTQDISNAPDALTRQRYGLIPELVVPPSDVTAGGQEFAAQVLPVVIRCREPIKAGQCLLVRLAPSGLEQFAYEKTYTRLIAQSALSPVPPASAQDPSHAR